jgi:transcriptional regulator with XRE-family HTH domain
MRPDPFVVLLEGLGAAGLTDAEIAERAEVSRDTIWRFRNGMARQPTLDTYVRLARAYQSTTGHEPPALDLRRR